MSESGSSKDELHLIQYIVKDVIRDIGTQTSNTNSTEDENTTSQSTTGLFPKENVSNSALETRGLNNPNSSIRLFIVPDRDSVTECSASPGLKLSLQKPSDGEANSFCISIACSPDDYRSNTTASKLSKSSVKSQTPNAKEKKGLRLEASKSLESTDNNFLTEHQLMCSENPSVVAWLKLKNFEEKQKRRAKRREKRELRKVASDEAKKRKRREKENEMRFALWLRTKKSDAKRAWRENRAKRRVDAVEERQQKFSVSSEDIPPPNYTVVPSFKGTQALAEGLEALSIGELADVRNNGSNEEHVKEITTLKGRGAMNGHQNSSFVQSGGCTPTPELVRLDERPNTATERMKRSDSGNEDNKGPHVITYDAWTARKRKKDKKVRPTTASGQLTNSGKQDNKGSNGITYDAWMAQKRPKNKQVRPRTASERLTGETDRDSEGSKRITYDAWMERKRHENKEKAKQRKREIVDDALTAGILKVARKRVENIGEGKKVLDTGMPKWRAKNKVRSMAGGKTPDTPNPWREYVMRPDSEESKTCINIQNNSEKNLEVRGGSPKSGGVDTIRKIRHTIKSDSNDIESAGGLRESDYSVAKIINVPDNVRSEKLASDIVKENRTQIASPDEKFRIGRRCSDEKTIRDRKRRHEKTTVRDNYFVYGEGLDPPSMTPAKWEPGDE